MTDITWNDFQKIELKVGTITKVEDVPEARNPAYKLWIDFGDVVKKSSGQYTELYSKEELVGQQCICVINFPPKQVGKFMSEVLVCGFYSDEGVVLAVPERKVKNGLRLG